MLYNDQQPYANASWKNNFLKSEKSQPMTYDYIPVYNILFETRSM